LLGQARMVRHRRIKMTPLRLNGRASDFAKATPDKSQGRQTGVKRRDKYYVVVPTTAKRLHIVQE
jgi:hypothetical protein